MAIQLNRKMFNPPFMCFVLSVCAVLLFQQLIAQTGLEEWFDENEDPDAIADIAEYLDTLRDHPVDLNRASGKELIDFPFFTPVLAKKIIQERKQNGPFASFDDFRKRMQMDAGDLNLIQSFLLISVKKRSGRDFKYRWRLSQKRPLSCGFTENKYSGSAWKNYQRFRFRIGSFFSGGIIVEKDPGESSWCDHWAGYAEMILQKPDIRFLLGHYRIETGCGLVLWGPYGFSMSADAGSALRKQPAGLKGNLCSSEYGTLSGCAAEMKFRQFSLLIFVSKAAQDAMLDPESQILSFVTSGLHRTGSEIEKMNRVHEQLCGSRLVLRWAGGHAGITGWLSRYSHPVAGHHTGYKIVHFHGTRNGIAGAECAWHGKLFGFSCELAAAMTGGTACIANFFYRTKTANFLFSYRNYDRDYANFHAGGFCQRTVQNEKGWKINYTEKWPEKMKMNLSYHAYAYPWMTYLMPVPKRGSDFLCQLTSLFSGRITCIIRTRFRSSEVTDSGISMNGIPGNLIRHHFQEQYRLECHYQSSSRFRIRIRFEANKNPVPPLNGEISAEGHNEWGCLLYHDIRIKPASAIRIDARWIVYDTQSYLSRLYAYEPDLPGSSSLSPLFLQGTRGFVMLCWQVINPLRISFKYASVYHDGVSYWGSGNDQIESDVEKRYGFQVDVQW